MYDVIPFVFLWQTFGKDFRKWVSTPEWNRETLSQLIAVFRADAIITVSRNSAQDIRRIFWRRNVFANPIVLEDAPTLLPVKVMKQFVYLGGMNFRKRLDVLIKAFSVFVTRHPDHRLVLIGSNYDSIANMVKELDLKDKVVLTGYVSHREKFEILKASIAIVYPSLYEGYGMAIAEGMQAGIPVIAGTGGSQLEVGGDGVRRIDPTSPESVTAAMEEVLDPIVRAHWVQRGREQLGRLTSPDIERNLVRFFVEQATMARNVRQ